MKYTPTDVAGVTIVDIEPHCDHRGFFSRSFCANEFALRAEFDMVQTNISYNYARGTMRGLHRQVPPHAEAKLVRCTRARSSTLRWTFGPNRALTANTSWCGSPRRTIVRCSCRRMWLMAFRHWLTTPKCFTKSAVTTNPRVSKDSLGRPAIRNRMATASDYCFREGRQLAVAAAGRERGLMTDRASRRTAAGQHRHGGCRTAVMLLLWCWRRPCHASRHAWPLS